MARNCRWGEAVRARRHKAKSSHSLGAAERGLLIGSAQHTRSLVSDQTDSDLQQRKQRATEPLASIEGGRGRKNGVRRETVAHVGGDAHRTLCALGQRDQLAPVRAWGCVGL